MLRLTIGMAALGVAVCVFAGCGAISGLQDDTGVGGSTGSGVANNGSTSSSSSGPGSPDSLTCETPAGPGHLCLVVTGPVASSSPCADFNATSVASCSPGGVGTCTLTATAGGITESESVTYYPDLGVSAAQIQSACEGSGGTFTPG